MAFSFFRRRQKLVLVVMVLLMVAFLLSAAFQNLGKGSSPRKVLGSAGDTKIRRRDLTSASDDIRILQALGLQEASGQVKGSVEFRFLMGVNAQRDPVLAWTLLLLEARELGVKVHQREVDDFLVSMGLTGQDLQRRLKQMKRDIRAVNRAVANHLTITEAAERMLVRPNPPLAELRAFHRDLRERIDLGVVAFDAKDFLAKAPEPKEEDILAWFEARRRSLPMHPSNLSRFGFGYRWPERVDVSWLRIDRDRVRQAVTVPERMMLDYWRRHKSELTKEVKVPLPATLPAATQPAESAEPEYRTVQMKYSEAKEKIRQIKRAQVGDVAVSRIIQRLRALIEQHGDSDDPYREAFKAITAGSGSLLARRVGNMTLTRGPLEKVLASLESASDVQIKFPYGEHDKLSIEPTVIVDVGEVKPDQTVGEVLTRIRIALKLPAVEWAAVEGLNDALFATKPVDLLPVSVGRTGLMPLTDLPEHEVLGRTYASAAGGNTLAQTASTAKPFHPAGQKIPPLVDVGSDYRLPMYVLDDRPGRLLWRLHKALPPQDPERLTPQIREAVVRDMKLAAAYELARAQAQAVRAQVSADKPLEAVAADKKADYLKTGLFSRKWIFPDRMTGALMVVPSPVPRVGQSVKLLEQAFELVPPAPEGWSDPGPTGLVDMRRDRKVLVVQRIGYEPPLEAEFQSRGVQMASMIIGMEQQRDVLASWVALPNVVRRVGYEPAESSRKKSKKQPEKKPETQSADA